MREISIDDIKTEFGETVLNCALINLFTLGKKSFEKTNLQKQIVNLNQTYTNQDQQNTFLPISLDFALRVLNCEYKLCGFDEAELLTYYSRNSKEG